MLVLSRQVHDDAHPGVQAIRVASRGNRAHVGGAGRRPALLDGRRRGRPIGLQLLHELPHEAQIRAVGMPASSHSTAWCSNIWVMKHRSAVLGRMQAVIAQLQLVDAQHLGRDAQVCFDSAPNGRQQPTAEVP